jgi:hypothetical protein
VNAIEVSWLPMPSATGTTGPPPADLVRGHHGLMALSRSQAMAVSRAALSEVAHLTGKDSEKVVSLRREGEVWVLEVDVVDMRRIPDTTDIMATYAVRLDDGGNVLELHRVRRYVRAWIGDQH